MKNEFSIVIPIFNESENILKLVKEIKNTLKDNYLYEIIIVDDCSSDNLDTIIKNQYFSNCIIVRHKKNMGQSESIKSGILKSKFDSIITIDGDLQNDPKDIPNLIRIYQNKEANYNLVAGIRLKRMDSLVKKISSLSANYIRKIVLQDNCNDTGCGLKIFTKKMFLEFPFFNGIHRFLPALFRGYGYNTYFESVNHRKRTAGLSKYGTLSRLILGVKDMIKVKKIINKKRNKNV